MTGRRSAWEDDPAPARLRFEPPTAPLPYGAVPGYGPDDGGWDPPPRRRRRRGRRLAAFLIGLIVLAGVIFGGLYLVTPSVRGAPALARAIDHAHHVAYPGPPVPALFAESLVATEDHRFYSEPGIDVFAVARVAPRRAGPRSTSSSPRCSTPRVAAG